MKVVLLYVMGAVLFIGAVTACGKDGAATKRKLQRQLIEEIALTEGYLRYYSDYHIANGDSASRAKCDSLNNELSNLNIQFNITMVD